jgi:hypothetical protein
LCVLFLVPSCGHDGANSYKCGADRVFSTFLINNFELFVSTESVTWRKKAVKLTLHPRHISN